jgi:hypothetical protein
MGSKTYQREIIDTLNRRLPDHLFDNLVNYDFFNVVRNGIHKHQLAKLIDAEDDYRQQHLFILDDITPECLEAAWEVLPYNERANNVRIPIKTYVYMFFTSGRVDKDCRRISKIVNEKDIVPVKFSLNRDFDNASKVMGKTYEIAVLNSNPELVLELQRE